MRLGTPKSWIICFAIALVSLTVFGVTSAFGHSTNGGNSIASAPALPLNHTVASGWNNSGDVDNTNMAGEFWKLKMAAGDRFVIDIADTTGQGCGSGIFAWAPNVTDYTISQTNPVWYRTESSTKYEYSWVAPSAGQWRLFFYGNGCNTYSYTFNALLQLFTTTTLNAPPTVVALHHKVKLAGSIGNGGGGSLLLKVQGPHHFKLQKLLAVVGGTFKYSFKPKRTGRYYASARYSGDSHHRPSSSKRYTIRVVK